MSKTELDLSALIDHLQNAINDYQSKVFILRSRLRELKLETPAISAVGSFRPTLHSSDAMPKQKGPLAGQFQYRRQITGEVLHAVIPVSWSRGPAKPRQIPDNKLKIAC